MVHLLGHTVAVHIPEKLSVNNRFTSSAWTTHIHFTCGHFNMTETRVTQKSLCTVPIACLYHSSKYAQGTACGILRDCGVIVAVKHICYYLFSLSYSFCVLFRHALCEQFVWLAGGLHLMRVEMECGVRLRVWNTGSRWHCLVLLSW